MFFNITLTQINLMVKIIFQGRTESCSSGSEREWGGGGEQGGCLNSFMIQSASLDKIQTRKMFEI